MVRKKNVNSAPFKVYAMSKSEKNIYINRLLKL